MTNFTKLCNINVGDIQEGIQNKRKTGTTNKLLYWHCCVCHLPLYFFEYKQVTNHLQLKVNYEPIILERESSDDSKTSDKQYSCVHQQVRIKLIATSKGQYVGFEEK